jgi:hypothetical protein
MSANIRGTWLLGDRKAANVRKVGAVAVAMTGNEFPADRICGISLKSRKGRFHLIDVNGVITPKCPWFGTFAANGRESVSEWNR